MTSQEGALRNMRFTMCDVSEALGSLSQMCRAATVWSPTRLGAPKDHTSNIETRAKECGCKRKVGYTR